MNNFIRIETTDDDIKKTRKILSQINKTRDYLNYIENHIWNVQKAWNLLKQKCKDMRFIHDDWYFNSINNLIENHDLSKLSEFEFIQYRKRFFPTEKEKEIGIDVKIFEKAWEHHKENNPHHWENWTKQKFKNPYEWEIHCVCMVCDWIGMSFEFGDSAQEYYEKNKNKIELPDYAIDFIYEIFKRIKR